MWCIEFYFVPNGALFEACGYKTKDAAINATKDYWFKDTDDNDFFINAELKKSAIIKIYKTV